MSSEQILPERPAEGADGQEGGEKLSKKALKKLEKEKEKAEKRKAQQEKDAAAKAEADANDVSKGHYGETPIVGSAEYKSLGRVRHKLSRLGQVTDGEEVAVRCRVTNARSQSAKLAFLNLRDRLDSIQAVVAASDTLSRQMVKFSSTVPAESIVDVIGLVKQPNEVIKSATISNRELHITQIWIVSKSNPQLPIQIDDAERAIPNETAGEEQKNESGRPLVGLATRLDNRVLDLRSSLNQAIFEIRDGVHQLFEEFLRSQDPPFLRIDTPKLLGAPSEGGANVFEAKYFDKLAYLAQSPQVYKQMLIAADYKRVYEAAPVFRAENSNTSRHLTEYTSLDLEMEFENHYDEVLFLIRDLMLHILTGLGTLYQRQTERVRKEYKTEPFLVPKTPDEVPILTFSDGVKMLRDAGVEISELEDINSTEEKMLGDLVRKKYNTDFYILKEYPLVARAFYTMPSATNPKFSHSYDFMLRGQEVLSGAQRIHDQALLRERMLALGVNPDGPGLKDYVQAFAYGCAPHAGGAFGAERVVLNWLGLGNVRLATLFPRDPSRLTP